MPARHAAPFRAEHVGSFIRPPELVQARDAFSAGRITAKDLSDVEDKAINDVVAMQEEKSQHKNKAKAMKILRAKLYEAERDRQDKARAAERKDQVGSGDRSERIRTYNFPQGRVSEHRINLTLYKLPQIMEGEALGEIVDALVAEHQAAQLAAEGAG